MADVCDECVLGLIRRGCRPGRARVNALRFLFARRWCGARQTPGSAQVRAGERVSERLRLLWPLYSQKLAALISLGSGVGGVRGGCLP